MNDIETTKAGLAYGDAESAGVGMRSFNLTEKETEGKIMTALDFLSRMYGIYFYIAVFAISLWGMKEYSEEDDGDKASGNRAKDSGRKVKGWENKVYKAQNYTVIFVLIAVMIFLPFYPLEYKYVAIIISIPAILMLAGGMLLCVYRLAAIINSNDGGKLSFKDWSYVVLICILVWELFFLKVPYWLLDNVSQYSNAVLSDILTAVIYVGFIFVYIFFILATAPAPMYYCIVFLRFVKKHLPFKRQRKQIGDYLVVNILAKVKQQSFLVDTMKYIRESKHFITRLLYLLFPVIYCIDIIKLLLSTFLAYFKSCLGCAVFCFRKAENKIKRVLLKALNLQEKRIIAVSFRLSLIFSFVIVVVANRYEPIFKVCEESTAIFEFIGSAVIIPVIFEWIHPLNVKRKREKRRSGEQLLESANEKNSTGTRINASR